MLAPTTGDPPTVLVESDAASAALTPSLNSMGDGPLYADEPVGSGATT
jgi:hypothetical protein